jgi:SAM-dependent methyltransferase
VSAIGADAMFAGSIPEVYDTYLVPLIFEPYAADLAARLASRPLRQVLEIAAGTGVVTRAMASALPAAVSIVATDLNQSMLDQAAARGTSRPVTWRQADAMALPFPDASFDAVVCQFGIMFLPDKGRAHAEIRRVLRSPGLFLFNLWDRIEENELAGTTAAALEAIFPEDPPRFLTRTPYVYHDPAAIAHDLAAGGFTTAPAITTLAARSRAASCEGPAIGFCQGTPLRMEIEARGAGRLTEATAVVARSIASRFGRGPVDGKMQAHVVTIAT